MDLSLLAVAGLGLFLAGIIKGSTGLGYSSCALPFLATSIGLKPAMGLVIIPALATNISVAFSAGHFREIVTRFSPLYLAMLPGIAVGVVLSALLATTMAAKLLGLVIITYALMSLARPRFQLPPHYVVPLQMPTGFANGVITGLTGSQVMPLFPYMMSIELDSDRHVQAINLAVMIASVFLAISLLSAGLLTPDLVLWSIVAIAPALLGVQIGNALRKQIPAQHFRSVVLYVLMGTGALLLLRGH